ncbi:MAG TPA: cytochrome P450 [Mycobacteriales bacterium]|nr:cytochrome P450 [Mycobacteriales bacterium]
MAPVAAGCPVAADLELLDPGFLSDPFPLMSAWREKTPVFYVPEVNLHFVTRYEDVEAIFLDRDTFGAANASSPVWPLAPAVGALLAEKVPRKPTLNNADPPRHGPMRTAVLKALTPRRIAAMEPVLREVAGRLIDELAAKPVTDLVADLAFPFPGYAGFSLLGFPEHDWDLLKQWCRKRVQITYGRLSDEEQMDVAQNVVAFWEYCDAHVGLREREPADDFTSDLLAYASEHPDLVNRLDVVTIVYSIALAGHDTTTCAFTSGLRYLLAERAQWEAIVADRSLAVNAVEEMLRFDPPILGHRRVVLRDTEVAGVPLPEGAHLFLCFASAHRDPQQFPEPDRFDIRRTEARSNLSFGKGVHFCIGAPLARLEMKIAVELLAERVPELRLVRDQDYEITPNIVFRSMKQLLAETGAR